MGGTLFGGGIKAHRDALQVIIDKHDESRSVGCVSQTLHSLTLTALTGVIFLCYLNWTSDFVEDCKNNSFDSLYYLVQCYDWFCDQAEDTSRLRGQ
jgi:hypothetical protein